MTNVVQAGAVTLGLVVVLVTDEVVFDGVIAFVLGCYLLWIAAGHPGRRSVRCSKPVWSRQKCRAAKTRFVEVAGARSRIHELRTRRTGQVAADRLPHDASRTRRQSCRLTA